jgi:predicted nucleotidyltransferase
MVETKENILKTLNRLKNEIGIDYKVKKIGLFGSYVKHKQNDSSDIDILVDFEDDADLIHFIGLSRYLEEIFKVKVDVVSKSSLKEELKQSILQEVIYE